VQCGASQAVPDKRGSTMLGLSVDKLAARCGCSNPRLDNNRFQ
jgi:hypothetical protein